MASWLKPLSIIALLGFPVALIGKRLELFGFDVSFQIIQITFLIALLVFFVGMIISLRKRKSHSGRSHRVGTAIYISLIPIVGLGTQIFSATSVPEIHNITTDTTNPPAFNKVISLRGANSNSHIYNATELAAVQTAAYPQVKTYYSDQSVSAMFDKSLQVIKDMSWVLVSHDANAGIIEATETTPLWGFKDDVVIRISKQNEKTAVDLTSVSRIGRSDLGANAKRIVKFINALRK